MKRGLVLPNRQWDAWTEEELWAIIDLHPEVIQVLVFHQQPDWVWQTQKFQLLDIHKAIGCQFEYRIIGVGPSDSALDIVTWLGQKLAGLPVGKIICLNEPNIPSEGWEGTDWVAWVREFGRIWKAMGLRDKLITPALSPNGVDGFFQVKLNCLADLVRNGLYDYLGIHWYERGHIYSWFDLPICITECDGAMVSDAFDYLATEPDIQEAIWFSSRWLSPDPGYHWDLIGNSELSESFKAWKPTVQEANMVALTGQGQTKECPEYIYDIVKATGIKYGVPYKLLLAYAFCESGFSPDAQNYNPPTDSSVGTTDYGLFQINSYWHPNFSLDLKFDPSYNTAYACDLILAEYGKFQDWYKATWPWSTRDKAWAIYQEWQAQNWPWDEVAPPKPSYEELEGKLVAEQEKVNKALNYVNQARDTLLGA